MAVSRIEKNAGDLFMTLYSDWKGITEKDDRTLKKAGSSWRKMFPNNEKGRAITTAAIDALTDVLSGFSEGGGKITKRERQKLIPYFSQDFINYIAGKGGTKAIFARINTLLKKIKQPNQYVVDEIRKGNNDVYDLLFVAVKAGHTPSIQLMDDVQKAIRALGFEGGYYSKDKNIRMAATVTLNKLANQGNTEAINELMSVAQGKYLDTGIKALGFMKELAKCSDGSVFEYNEEVEHLKYLATDATNPVIREMAEDILIELKIDVDKL